MFLISGILMFVAWILFVGVTTVISRHYKDGFGSKFVLGTKLWFQVRCILHTCHLKIFYIPETI